MLDRLPLCPFKIKPEMSYVEKEQRAAPGKVAGND